MSNTIEKVKCLIIGSGPAGYTAAIYAARANMYPVLYQGTQPGGQLTTTNEVENFPGYPDGVTGPEMMVQLQAQAQRFGTDVRDGWVTKVDFSGPVHKVWVNETKEIHAETIIISTGASAKYLGLESEQLYLKLGGGVSACARPMACAPTRWLNSSGSRTTGSKSTTTPKQEPATSRPALASG
jgi:thioredoxin reductase (NADPH)